MDLRNRCRPIHEAAALWGKVTAVVGGVVAALVTGGMVSTGQGTAAVDTFTARGTGRAAPCGRAPRPDRHPPRETAPSPGSTAPGGGAVSGRRTVNHPPRSRAPAHVKWVDGNYHARQRQQHR